MASASSLSKNNQSLSLTVLIQTKNEEDHIVACIKSCKNFSEIILVVDMESTDETRERALDAGATVVKIKDQQKAEASRQQAIDMVKTEWVLILDADERLHDTLKVNLLQHISAATHQIFRLPRKNMLFGKWLRHGLWWPDYQTRLFKKSAVVWPTEIHTQPIVRKPVMTLPARVENAIVHHHTTSLHARLRKVELQASQELFYPSLRDIQPNQVFDRITSEFAHRFYSHHGYKDGMHGFIAAKLMQYYRFIEFATYWEKQGYPELFSKEQLKQTWDFSRRIELLRNENKRIRDSKFFTLYTSLKKWLRRSHV